ncbi:hypothetical protein [Sphingomicrobium lutaoense]|uniref:Uncharacterized protein n=1 Tax=Sphingomicrobium lutaoense TaxID=515949 RepID=A0A839Z127_9SPHN|nr:hypothetical protein [Sphingomicrobium lutaoense]MBB3763275.1 hypothetical protein [Sphingomicrobium lutaoense]
MKRPALPLFLAAGLAACGPAIDAPSLDYRPAEAIDPRLPVESEPAGPGEVTLAREIEQLIARAREGEAAFDAFAPQARSLVASAGAPGSESWTAAQKMLSRLDAARAPTIRALADLDQLATGRVAREAWVAPANRAAIAEAAARVAEIDARQSALIDRLTGQLTP